MTRTSTPRAHGLPDGGASYRLTPRQVQDMVATVVANLSQEDLDVLRELAAEREIPGDLTVDIGRGAVDCLWDETLVDAAKSPLLMSVRLQFSAGQVREIAACGAPPLSAESLCPECGAGDVVSGEYEAAVGWWHVECSAGCGFST